MTSPCVWKTGPGEWRLAHVRNPLGRWKWSLGRCRMDIMWKMKVAGAGVAALTVIACDKEAADTAAPVPSAPAPAASAEGEGEGDIEYAYGHKNDDQEEDRHAVLHIFHHLVHHWSPQTH